jgi:hypothetical protein
MRALPVVAFVAISAVSAACGEPLPSDDAGADARGDTSMPSDATTNDSARDAVGEVAVDAPRDVPADVAMMEASVDAPADTMSAVAPTAAELLALTTSCMRIAGSPLYALDSGETATVPLCQLTGAIYWQADMDVDCDGGSGAECMSDPYYQPDTSGVTSTGQPLDASTLPFIVIPLPRTGFDYRNFDIHIGSVAAVIYRDRVVYAIFGDAGPSSIIGEGSFALAQALGIDPDPSTGGVGSGVTYIVFQGADGRVTHNEDHDEATRIGEARAMALVSGG